MCCKTKKTLGYYRYYVKHPIIIGLIFSVVLTLVIFHKFLTSRGIAITGDLVWAYSNELFPRYIWHPFTQRSILPGLIIWTNIVWQWFSSEIAEKIFILIIFILMGTSIFYVSFKLLEEFNIEFRISIICSSIAMITYVISPIVVTRIPHIHFLTGYALAPLIFFLVFNYFEKKENNVASLLHYSIFTSIVWSVMTLVDPHWIFLGIFLITFFTIFAFHRPYKTYLVKAFLYITLTIIFYLMFSAWQFLMYFMILREGVIVSPPYILSVEVLKMLSRYATVLHVLIQQANWWPKAWPGEIYLKYFDTLVPYTLWIFSNFVIPIMAFIVILTPFSKNKKTISLIILIILIIPIATGVKYSVLRHVYEYIIFKAPLISYFGWAFRDPDKWNALVRLSYSLLCAVTVGYIVYKIKKNLNIYLSTFFIIIIIIIVITFNIISSFPLLTGDLSGKLSPKDIPSEYKKLNKWLENQDEYFKVFVYPTPPKWGLPKPVVPENTYWRFIIHKLLNNQTTNVGKLLSIGNVKYIIIESDKFKKSKNNIMSILLHQKDLKFVTSFNSLYIYKNIENKISNIYIPAQNGITADLNNLISLSSIEFYNPTNLSFFIYDRLCDKVKYKYILKKCNIFIIKRNINIQDFLVFNYPTIKPFDAIIHHNPSKLWSKAMTSDPLHGDWHPYLERFGIENWQFDYGYGLVFTWAKKTNLTIPFKVDKTDNYKLFIRYFKNQKGGEMVVYLDGKPIVINTKDQLNKFVWKDLGTFHLKAGEHKIVLENVEGFNAVNLFVLIPEKDYYKALEDVKKILQNKTVIYIFEAESDLYRTEAKTIKDIKASNGEEILFSGGKAWQDVEVLKPGTYRIALKGEGSFKVKMGNHTFLLKSDGNFTYTPPFHLDEGRYRLEILPETKNAKLDVVWLYSSSETIPKLFEVKEKLAKIISYEKINPTLWKVKVQAKKPFMLSFAEAYDPLWEARIYKDGKLVEKVRSIPLYSVINGFWINETGNLTIVIRYTPQDWFELGLKISATTFIGCIAFLFYDWRREKGDKWAKRIEELLKHLRIRKRYET